MAPDGARSEESDHTRELQPLLKRTSEIGCAQALGRGWPQAMVQAMVRAMVHAMSNDFGQPMAGVAQAQAKGVASAASARRGPASRDRSD